MTTYYACLLAYCRSISTPQQEKRRAQNGLSMKIIPSDISTCMACPDIIYLLDKVPFLPSPSLTYRSSTPNFCFCSPISLLLLLLLLLLFLLYVISEPSLLPFFFILSLSGYHLYISLSCSVTSPLTPFPLLSGCSLHAPRHLSSPPI